MYDLTVYKIIKGVAKVLYKEKGLTKEKALSIRAKLKSTCPYSTSMILKRMLTERIRYAFTEKTSTSQANS